jgi:hypothetical protein
MPAKEVSNMRKITIFTILGLLVGLLVTGFPAHACRWKVPRIKIRNKNIQWQKMTDKSVHILDNDTEVYPDLPDVQPGPGPRGVADMSKIAAFPMDYDVEGRIVHVIPNPYYEVKAFGDNYYGFCVPEGTLVAKYLGNPATREARREGIIIPAEKPEYAFRRAVMQITETHNLDELLLVVNEAKQPQVVGSALELPGSVGINSSGSIGGGYLKHTTAEKNGRGFTFQPFEPLFLVTYTCKEPTPPPKRPEPPKVPEPSAAGVINTPKIDDANVNERMNFGYAKLREYYATGDITPLAIARDQFLQVATDVAPKNKESWKALAFCDHLISQHPATNPENRKIYRDRARWSATWADRGGWKGSLEELWTQFEAMLGVKAKPPPPSKKERKKPAKVKTSKAPMNPTERAIAAREEMRRW